MPPITTIIPTQQQLYAMQNDPNTLLAQFTRAHSPAPVAGSPAAVTAAGSNPFGLSPSGSPSNLNSLSNPDWIKAMSEMISNINIDAQQKANAARIPNATGLESKSSEDIGAALRGELPADVVRQLGQRAAERGVYTGNPMGASTTADLMRSLGLTSLDLTNKGQEWLTAALGRNPGATPANTQALVTTPAQAEQLAIARENMQLDYLAKMAAIQEARNRTRSGYGGGGGGSGGGSFRPATNWSGGGAPTQTATPTPIVPGWSDPGNPSSPYYYNDQMFNEDLDNFYPEYGVGAGVTPTYDTTPYEWDNLLPQMSPPYEPPGGINTEGMTQDELDWLYNVGG